MQKQRANKNTGVMPVFFTEEVSMRLIVVSIMVTLLVAVAALLAALCRGRGMATNIIRVCNGMCVTRHGVMSPSSICHSLWFDTLLLPIDIHHGPYE